MLLQTLALLASLSASPSDFEAPPVPPWPADVPAAVLVPKAGRCLGLDGSDLGAGIYMPDRLAGIINGRLEALTTYQERCQARINGAVDVTKADDAAAWQRHRIEETSGVPLVTVVGLTVGALVVGAIGGLALGAVLVAGR